MMDRRGIPLQLFTCLLLLAANAACGLAEVADLSDTFDGAAIDGSKWWIYAGPATSVVQAGGKVVLTAPASPSPVECSLTSQWRLRGPFDVQVEYQLIDWPTDRYAGLGLLTMLPGDNCSIQRASVDWGGPSQLYLVNYLWAEGNAPTALTPTADTAGTLRLVRDADSILTAMYRSSGSLGWVTIYAAATPQVDIGVILALWGNGDTPLQVAFDSFQVNVGQLPSPWTFLDVPADSWAYNEIAAAAKAAIISGYPDGTYRPAEGVTRDQMAVYISRGLAGGDANVPTGPSAATFSDVSVSHWAFRYVEYAREAGIVTGYSPTVYAPAAPVDRGQMAVFVARSVATPTGEAGVAGYIPPVSPSFPDVPVTLWAYKYVEYIKSKSITGGYPDGAYQPGTIVTRDQMAVYIARAFHLWP